MRRIIIFAYDFPSNNGGIARLCGEIYNQCHQHGIPVLIITCAEGDEADDIIRIYGRRGVADWKMLLTLKKNLHEGDVILTGTYHPDGMLATLTGYPVFMLAHGAEFLPGNSFFRQHIWPLYRRWVLPRATMVIANSHYTARLVQSCSSNAKVTALPLGVDPVRFSPQGTSTKDGLLHLCTISRLLKFKAQDFVIRTIASLPDEYRCRIRYDIAGKGEYKPELERLVCELNLENIVSFKGFVPDDALSSYYSEHDVFILTTREEPENKNVEGFGLVFAEAQACGIPCIGSRTGGIPDAVEDGNGGWLIEPDNEEELRQLLIQMLDHPKIVREMGNRAIKRIHEQGTWEHYFSSFLQMVNNALDISIR